MAKLTRDEALVRAAKLRAGIIGYLNQNTGWRTITEMCLALDVPNDEQHRALSAATILVKAGEIQFNKHGVKNTYCIGFATAEPESEPRKRPAKSLASSTKDVEIVIAGVLVIVGKNPATGRLRITLEEAR